MMFRCLLIKRLLKSIKTRYLGSKHERTSSSLHEYLDVPLQRKSIWRGWLPIILAGPLVYYLIIMNHDIGHSSKMLLDTFMASSDSDQERESFMSIPIRYSAALFLLHDHRRNGVIPFKSDSKSSILARIPARHDKPSLYFSYDKRDGSKRFQPFCKVVRSYNEPNVTGASDTPPSYVFDHYNLMTVLEYRNFLQKGGYHESPLCRARHRIAVIVPYRNRERNLAVFLYIMHPFLIEQGLEYRIFVIEQSGTERFNRGRLLNVGFLEAQKHGVWGCMVFHDVDLLPTTDKIKYTCSTWPRHMCGSIIGRPESDKYKSHYGGVTVMSPKHFEQVNGYSNSYWGWGGEDTDMFWRIKFSSLPLTRYSKTVAVYKALPHAHEEENPIRKKLLHATKDRYKTDGLSNCPYKIIFKKMYHTYTHILVDINPDKENITEFLSQWE